MAGFLVGALVGGGIGWLIGSERVIQVRKKNPRPSDFSKGELVYFDSMRGLIPAKFVGLEPPKPLTGTQDAVLQITSSRHPGYRKGETIRTSLNTVVKRSWVHRSGGQVKIIEPRR